VIGHVFSEAIAAPKPGPRYRPRRGEFRVAVHEHLSFGNAFDRAECSPSGSLYRAAKAPSRLVSRQAAVCPRGDGGKRNASRAPGDEQKLIEPVQLAASTTD